MPDHGQIPFTPAPEPVRHDGWTVEKQRTFLYALADTGCVTTAAREAGMSVRSAYRLKRRLGAGGFADGWRHALGAASHRLTTIAYDRAINGTPREVWHKGEKVGEERRHNDRMLMFLLKHTDPVRFGRLSGLHPHEVRDIVVDAECDLAGALHKLRDEAETEAVFPD